MLAASTLSNGDNWTTGDLDSSDADATDNLFKWRRWPIKFWQHDNQKDVTYLAWVLVVT